MPRRTDDRQELAVHLGHHTTVTCPEGGVTPGITGVEVRPGVSVTSGITAPASAPGALFTVMPEAGPTPYRARATV